MYKEKYFFHKGKNKIYDIKNHVCISVMSFANHIGLKRKDILSMIILGEIPSYLDTPSIKKDTSDVTLSMDEIKDIHDVEKEYSGKIWRLELFERMAGIYYKDTYHHLLCDGKIIGLLVLGTLDGVFEIRTLEINERYRGKGYGAYFVNEIKNNYDTIRLSSTIHGYNFWIKQGFNGPMENMKYSK